MGKLTANDRESRLIDRNGQEAFLMADDFVKGEPIFLLGYQKDYHMRVRLIHKHQSDASNFQIKFVSVKTSDGIILHLKTIETRSSSEGSDAIAFIHFDKFQSVQVSSPSPQFGPIQKRFVRLPIIIGVEAKSAQVKGQNLNFELKRQILYRLETGNDYLRLHNSKGFESYSQRNLPHWTRDSAHGAIILSSMAAGNSIRAGKMPSVLKILSLTIPVLVLPCFRLTDMQVPTEE